MSSDVTLSHQQLELFDRVVANSLVAIQNGTAQQKLSPNQFNRFSSLVENALLARQDFFRQLMDPRRNIDDECGYPSSYSAIGVELYKQLFEREALANRAVSVMAKECWQASPEVCEDEDSDKQTAFEKDFAELSKQLTLQGQSWHEDADGSALWEYFARVDELSGIGTFGVLMLGFDDGLPTEQPVAGMVSSDSPLSNMEKERLRKLPALTANEAMAVERWANDRSPMGTDEQYFGVQFGPSEYPTGTPAKRKNKLLFLRPFDETLVQVVRYEWNVRNPRFGQPVMYRVTFNDPREQHSGVGLPLATAFVHWTRIIHVADNLSNSEIFGIPRLRPILNRVMDARKVYGAGGEGYWKSCFSGLSLETHPQLGGDVEVDNEALRNMVEQYQNGLQRFLSLMGMSAKTLSPQVIDPTSHVNVQMEAICIQLAIPVRVFKGSERGEMASTQDDLAWDRRVDGRRKRYITPRMVVPFVDRLILAGALSEPKQYYVRWPDPEALGDKDIAALAVQKTQALSAFIGGGCEAGMTMHDFWTRFMMLEADQATAIVDAVAEAHADGETMTLPPMIGGRAAAPPPGTEDYESAEQQRAEQQQYQDEDDEP